MRVIASVFAALFAALLAGCAGEPSHPGASKPATVTQNINLSGYPPEFRQGFTEGCNAGRSQASAGRPKGESQFAAGWADGYDYCVPAKK